LLPFRLPPVAAARLQGWRLRRRAFAKCDLASEIAIEIIRANALA
jgi:hypothetical protein